MGRVPKASSKFECLSGHLADRSFVDHWITLAGKLARLEAGGDLLRMEIAKKAPKSKKNPRDVQQLKENAKATERSSKDGWTLVLASFYERSLGALRLDHPVRVEARFGSQRRNTLGFSH